MLLCYFSWWGKTLDNFAGEFTRENNEMGRHFFKNGNLERAVYHFTLSLEQDENEESYFYFQEIF